jgi:hypothetical protein
MNVIIAGVSEMDTVPTCASLWKLLLLIVLTLPDSIIITRNLLLLFNIARNGFVLFMFGTQSTLWA